MLLKTGEAISLPEIDLFKIFCFKVLRKKAKFIWTAFNEQKKTTLKLITEKKHRFTWKKCKVNCIGHWAYWKILE